MSYGGNREQIFGHISYSQHGDDLHLANIFHLIGINKPSYLDLGAHHPLDISNTALFYSRGSRGVNVEANPYLIQAFREHRPEDRNLNVGVAKVAGMRELHLYDKTNGRNTFSLDELDPNCVVIERMQLPVVTINQIVESNCPNGFPDLLNTDIEGLDLEVLESADFSASSPKVICTEVRPQNPGPIKDLMTARGYFCFLRVSMNLIFVRNDFKEKLY